MFFFTFEGEKVAARSVINVTLLYSDIVGFTSICSTAQPIQIIEMLKRLYTDFDNYCGILDIYKIETIGDAYVAAGGLHKPSLTHAQQMAWMSLLMMESASNNTNHKGEKIKVIKFYIRSFFNLSNTIFYENKKDENWFAYRRCSCGYSRNQTATILFVW
jgi:class 3 adenylate cyclase